jgi:cation transport regulator ChaC
VPTHRRTWTVDSIEEGIAAVADEDGRMLRLPLWLLPDTVREGDVVAVAREEGADGVVLRVAVDRDATERALRRSREQVESAPPGPHPTGDIVL